MSEYFVTRSECTNRTIFPGVEIHTTAGEHMMLSYVQCEPGAIVEEHSHPHEQVGMIVKGSGTFHVGNEERLLRPGDMYRIPGNVVHRVVAANEGLVALDVFHPIREDYL